MTGDLMISHGTCTPILGSPRRRHPEDHEDLLGPLGQRADRLPDDLCRLSRVHACGGRDRFVALLSDDNG
jgi:hypothetical protein